MPSSPIGNNLPASVIMAGDGLLPGPTLPPSSPVAVIRDKPLQLTEEMCDARVIGGTPPSGYVRLAESIPWSRVTHFYRASKEKGHDDAYSEAAGRYVAWIDCLYWDLYQWKRRIVARVDSVLAPFQHIPITAIHTMPCEQTGWEQDVLVLQDGTRLFNVHVSSVVADIQPVPSTPTNQETPTIRQSQSKHYPPDKVKAWYLQWVEGCKRKDFIPSKEDDLKNAKVAFPNIDREQVRDARRECAFDQLNGRRRRRNVHDDALLKNKLEAVLKNATQSWPNKHKRPPISAMVKELIRQGKAQGYDGETLRKILSGTYRPAKRLRISTDW